MKTKIAINGFGRIGRNAFKIAYERSDLEIVAINDLTDTKTLAHLLKHDSNYGAYQHEVSFDETNLIVEGQKIKVLSEKDPAKLPWGDLGVQVVIESTGFFVDPAKAKAHIEAGAKKVIISAPAKGEGAETIVIGVNEDKAAEAGEIISNASCTTNCITPVMGVLEANFGIEKAMMTTVHSYTASQVLQDGPAKDLREARSAAINIVPTTTGASIAAAKALPALEGIFGGMSVRVPTPVVSLSDFVVVTKKTVTVDEVNEAFKKAAADPYYQGILDITEDELVSSDFIGNSHSAIVDLKLTAVVGGNLLKVVAWYDNEWGYSNRLVELTADVGQLLNSDGQSNDTSSRKPDDPVPSTAPKLPDDDDSKTPANSSDNDKADEDYKKDEKPKFSIPVDEPLVEEPDSAHEDLLEAPKLESLDHQPQEDKDDRAAGGDNAQGAAYIISGEKDSVKAEDHPTSDIPTPKLPPDATNIDGIRHF
ncbi:MAG TPA: type I glyceraldehyde-3-phosphate dehydrogenase [Candidatus Saccharimonadales bacterium]|nr:type I glyceraldehyde-3-phosphate dehydrogenase [Candidatus Saccharimonadales bacterium]